jgi:hypothetical protein
MKHRVLNHADNIIHGERQRDYGSASHSFSTIADLWSAYLGHEVTPEQVCMMMILLKIGRSTKSAQFDSLVDIAGYAALADTVINGVHNVSEDCDGFSV